MTNRATRRTATLMRRRPTLTERITISHLIGERNARRTWYQPPRLRAIRSGLPGSYGWAKERAHELASLAMVQGTPDELGKTEHWADTLLHCPVLPVNRRTARFAGKPYHWRQDYTGQLKLAAGSAPW